MTKYADLVTIPTFSLLAHPEPAVKWKVAHKIALAPRQREKSRGQPQHPKRKKRARSNIYNQDQSKRSTTPIYRAKRNRLYLKDISNMCSSKIRYARLSQR